MWIRSTVSTCPFISHPGFGANRSTLCLSSRLFFLFVMLRGHVSGCARAPPWSATRSSDAIISNSAPRPAASGRRRAQSSLRRVPDRSSIEDDAGHGSAADVSPFLGSLASSSGRTMDPRAGGHCQYCRCPYCHCHLSGEPSRRASRASPPEKRSLSRQARLILPELGRHVHC